MVGIKIALFVLLHYCIVTEQASFCTTPKHEQLCNEFNQRAFPIKCDSFGQNNIDCILQVSANKTNLAVVSAEEALVANKFSDNLVVLAELLQTSTSNTDAAYETVVVVKNDFNGSFSDLRGKKYCHPGFHHQQTTTSYVLKKFESTVLQLNNVDICMEPGVTLIEKELSAISRFFGPSCRPGPWVDLENQDQILYSNYTSLCDLCENKFCDETSDSYKYPFDGALQCFLKNGGEVALTSRNVVESHIKNYPNEVNFIFFCPNGSTSERITSECIWSKEPWSLIVSNKQSAVLAQNQLRTSLNSTNGQFIWNNILGNQKETINYVPIVNLNDYLKPFLSSIPNDANRTTCHSNLTWCTVSPLEKDKCEWFSQAASNRGIRPLIQCELRSSKIECIAAIKNDSADITVVNANQFYIAKRHGLSTAAHILSHNRTIRTLLVVNETRINGSTGLIGLAKKSACFPLYGGIEWLSFVLALQTHTTLKRSCNIREYLAEFVGDSCAPGARDPDYELEADVETYVERFCNLCAPSPTSATATTCNANDDNKYNGNEGALHCLRDGGDYAVVTQDHYKVYQGGLRVLCKNGTWARESNGDLFDVDEGCALTVTTSEDVVFNGRNREEVVMALMQFEKWFGPNTQKSLKIFGTFNNVSDLLFKDSTVGFELVNTENRHDAMDTYLSIIDNCKSPKDQVGGAPQFLAFTLLILTMLVTVLQT